MLKRVQKSGTIFGGGGGNVQRNNNAKWLVQLEADMVNLNKQADVKVTRILVEEFHISSEENRKAIEQVLT